MFLDSGSLLGFIAGKWLQRGAFFLLSLPWPFSVPWMHKEHKDGTDQGMVAEEEMGIGEDRIEMVSRFW